MDYNEHMDTLLNWWQWLIVVCVLIVAGVVVWFVVFRYPVKTVRQELPPPAIEIKEYSLSGKVMAINGNEVTLSVGRVFVGDNGNYVAYEDKKVTVDDKTVISKVTNVDDKITIQSGVIKDLKVGSEIVVYSNSNIALQDSFTPARLDINL